MDGGREERVVAWEQAWWMVELGDIVVVGRGFSLGVIVSCLSSS